MVSVAKVGIKEREEMERSKLTIAVPCANRWGFLSTVSSQPGMALCEKRASTEDRPETTDLGTS